MPIRGVLFDMDDTLFDFSGSEAAGVLAHLRAEGLLDRFEDAEAALELWRTVTEAEYARFLAGEFTFTGQQRERTRKFLARIGVAAASDMSDAAATAWFSGYRAERDAVAAAFPDADPVLDKLAPGFRLGIVSNASLDVQRRKLGAIGLLPYFGDAIVCSEQHGVAKPAASIFHAGCALLGLEPHEVAYIGDNYALDAIGARDAGLAAYWLDRARTGMVVEPGIRVVHSLDELPDFLGG